MQMLVAVCLSSQRRHGHGMEEHFQRQQEPCKFALIVWNRFARRWIKEAGLEAAGKLTTVADLAGM